MDVFTFPIMGALGLGFVFGWTLYFAIRGKSGNISASEFAAIIGALAGGTVTAYFSGAADDNAIKTQVMGAYGIGVFFGFAAYFCAVFLTIRRTTPVGSTTDQMMAGALESLDNVPSARVPAVLENLPLRSRHMALDATAGAATLNIMTTVASEAGSVQNIAISTIATIDELLIEVAGLIPNTSGKKAEELRNMQFYLLNLKISVAAALGISALNSSQIRALFSTLSNESTKLNHEAAKLKSATKSIEKVNRLLASMSSLRDAVGSLS